MNMKFSRFLLNGFLIYSVAGLIWFVSREFGSPTSFHEVLLGVLVGWVAAESSSKD